MIPRLRRGELRCGACAHPGRILRKDDRGFLIGHDGRAFPCRVPLSDIDAQLFDFMVTR